MPLTRRSVLFGSAAFALGLSTSSCGDAGLPGMHTRFLGSKEVMGALRKLVKKAGRETFQSVDVTSYGTLRARLLMAEGGVQEFSYDGSWQKEDYDAKSVLTSPASIPIAKLPLDRLSAYVHAARVKVDRLTFNVDYVGKIQVTAYQSSDDVGLKLDGTGTVPELSPDEVTGVKAAIAEMVAVYGRNAERVGSFNGFVHMDANVAGCRAAQRIVRSPRLAAESDIIQEMPFSRSELFDPSGFDPKMALARKATIAKEARVEGKVWDWEYRRPPKGGEPLVSYGIGPKGPDTRVWLDKNGKIKAVLDGECPKGIGWCPA